MWGIGIISMAVNLNNYSLNIFSKMIHNYQFLLKKHGFKTV